MSQDGKQIDHELFDAFVEFVALLLHRGERLAERFEVPVSCMKALHRLDPVISMKDLGQQLHCDRSFVTMIADTLEIRGLATRQPNPSDRRIKNLVLTDRGLEVKASLERELKSAMPWSSALDQGEREQLLRLVRKMSGSMTAQPAATATTGHTGEVSLALAPRRG